jgi:protein-glutamine gamma-glutamyltransferase
MSSATAYHSRSLAGTTPSKTGRAAEPLYVTLIKICLYAVALILYLRPLSSTSGIGVAIISAAMGLFLADFAFRRHVRPTAVLVIVPPFLLAALFFGRAMGDSSWVGSILGISGALIAAEIATFGLSAFFAIFVLRFLANRARLFSLLEVLFVAGSVAFTLAAHRNRMLNRPRFFSDWAWSLGIDPSTVLIGIGAVALLLAVFLFLRQQPLVKVITTIVLMLLMAGLYYLIGDKKIEPVKPVDVLGLTGDKKKKGKGDKDKGKGGKGGKGEKGGKGGGASDSDNPFNKDNYQNNTPPQPVAIAILRDDYSPQDGILYFRQRTQSKYNGHHLTASEKLDRDVIIELPASETAVAQSEQLLEHHTTLPTTMYLLVDHPQPPALTHAAEIKLIPNPNPSQFVSAYDVKSQLLSVSPKRLLGRKSIPEDWSKKKREHYTDIPHDPRYSALADILVRKIDPRFADDDLARAFAIKRYLEKEGFYTRRTKHSSTDDPTASFLFGSLRGYCVHFAHAAVYLFRSQGIAARVALGYAVQTNKRSGGSSILVMGDRAHAWPEIHLEGIGWITFDVYPERTDMPPAPPVDYDLEKLLGELARKDPTGGVTPDTEPLQIPWAALGNASLLSIFGLFMLGYFIKGTRRLMPSLRQGNAYYRSEYRALLDLLSEFGVYREYGETRERHAQRLESLSPNLAEVTRQHLARAMGSNRSLAPSDYRKLVNKARAELKANSHWLRRIWAYINPIGWLWTR